MKKLISALSAGLLLAGSSLTGQEMPDKVKVSSNGSFSVGEAEFMIQTYHGSNWSCITNRNWKITRKDISKKGVSISAGIQAGETNGRIVQTMQPLSASEFELNCNLEFDEAVDVKSQSGTVSIPTGTVAQVFIDGKAFALPEKFDKMSLFSTGSAKQVEFVLAGGIKLKISGEMGLVIQDNRKFKTNTFAIRFQGTPRSGNIKNSNLKLRFEVSPVKTQPVDVAAAATRGFVYDGKQGWTDQGVDNDLRAFRQSTVKHHGLSFNICNPAKNNGKAAIVIGGKEQRFPHSATVSIPAGSKAGAVNLLHASAWTPQNGVELGKIELKYADGAKQSIPVISRTDCGNWWNPGEHANASVAWRAENAMSTVGLYASSFALKNDTPVELSFTASAPQAVWMIVGISLSDRAVLFDSHMPADNYIVAGDNWVKLDFDRQVKVGSPLDFSWSIDHAPAGKYGNVKAAQNGTLTFEKATNKHVRFYGANLCFSASFLDKNEVDKLVETFARNGYNSVRIHHHDTEMLDRNAPDTLTLSTSKMDQLDYLVAKMKEKGLYITTDFYTNRVFKKGDNIPEIDSFTSRQMKEVLPISKAAMENWKEFVRRWMNHRNPYTGLTWGEDPAVYMVNLVNEENLSNVWNKVPSIAERYKEKFAEWTKKNNISNAKASNNDHDFRRFLYELQKKCLEEQLDFVKNELKLNKLITSLNFISEVPYALLRDKFDLVDNHAYFAHPSFPEHKWRLPYGYRQDSSTARQGDVPRRMMPTRIFGKPFMVTEFNHCNPNMYRAEGGPLVGAYSSLQNWDGLYRFAWSHNAAGIIKQNPAVGFDAANDPMAQLSDRIITAMFLRGDVKAADVKVSYQVSEDMFAKREPINFANSFSLLGLVTQIGSNVAGQAPIPGVIQIQPANAVEPDALKNKTVADLWRNAIANENIKSLTGQISMQPQSKMFIVNSPLTESVTLEKGSATAGVMSIANADRFQTVCAISLDKKPLKDSRNIVVIHLTNVANTKQLFGNQAMTLLKHWGQLPHLVARGKATVSLNVGQQFKVNALALDGSPKGAVSGKLDNGRFAFVIDTAMLPGGVMAYHLTR